MKINYNNILIAMSLFVWLVISSCQRPHDNVPGSEFMPDMAHSVAYESNHYLYYYNNTWGGEDEYYKYAKPKEPVKGTVPRGYAGLVQATSSDVAKSLNGSLTNSSISVPMNGSVPYPYEDTEDDRMKAAADIMQNPFPITDAEMKEAKELYNIFCGICHGEKGDGAGYLVREDGGKYPAQPANLLLDQYVEMSNGQYYHAIMYGKNMMGAYKDKLSYEERWQVIHYIRGLQAKEKKLAYNETENTLNEWAIAGSMVKKMASTMDVEHAEHLEVEHSEQGDYEDGHSEDHGSQH